NIRRNYNITHFNKVTAIPIKALSSHDLLATAAVSVDRQDAAHTGFGFLRSGQPRVGPPVGQALQRQLFQNRTVFRQLNSAQDFCLEWDWLRSFSTHHQREK